MNRFTDCMPDVREPVTAQPSLVHRIHEHRMSDSDRQVAVESLRDGESLAALMCRASDSIRSGAALLAERFAQRAR